jgi:hypothetical protein
VINNFNVQASDTVTWSPDLCGDVSLQVKIDNLSLSGGLAKLNIPNLGDFALTDIREIR